MKALSDSIARVRAALIATDGNITRAADKLGCTKPYAMALVKRLGLSEFARGLRIQSGIPSTGRPPILEG